MKSVEEKNTVVRTDVEGRAAGLASRQDDEGASELSELASNLESLAARHLASIREEEAGRGREAMAKVNKVGLCVQKSC